MTIKEILAVILFIEIICLCIASSLVFINLQSTIAILIFNILFTSLIYQLQGSVTKKTGVLTVGNILGLFWNLVFYNFSQTGTQYLGPEFAVVYSILFPFLNLSWIVPFWSFSLSYMPNRTKIVEG